MQFHWAILYTFIRSYILLCDFCTLLYGPERSYTISSQTFISFLTHSNFTSPKHLKIYPPVLNYHKKMRSLSVHPNHCKKKFTFFFIQHKKRKMTSLSTKERKAKFNTDNLIFRKESNFPSGTLLSLSNYVDIIEYNSAESLTNKYKLFGTKSK